MVTTDPRTLKPWPFTPAEDRKALDRLIDNINRTWPTTEAEVDALLLSQDGDPDRLPWPHPDDLRSPDDLDVRPEQYDVDAQHDKGEW